MKGLTIASVALITASLICFVVAGILFHNTRKFVGAAESAPGTVVDLESRRSKGSTLYYPVVEFMGNDNRKIRFVSRVGSKPAGYDAGDRVVVLYKADEPGRARISSFFGLYLGTIIPAFIGVICGLLGAVFTFIRFRLVEE